MKKYASKIISLLLVCCMLFSLAACGKETNIAQIKGNGTLSVIDKIIGNIKTDDDYQETENKNSEVNVIGKEEQIVNNDNSEVNVIDNEEQTENNNEKGTAFEDIASNKGEYNKGVVLVKVKDALTSSMLKDLEYESYEALYKGSKWYSVKLANEDKTEEAVKYLSKLNTFEKVDYDYIMGVTADVKSVDISGNPNAENQTNLGVHNIPYGWTQNGKHPGGSPDVVVAVIDTGVDYNHLDLRNNIWVNTSEIPDNGIDDDNNGYVDDLRGWDCVGDDNDPMDDNGHGTHVAGIVAAENNKLGGIGVAYNCKVMVLKAGNSSGHFNSSDVAEAVEYAYMNGASVINMSFGGATISIAVEEALENAYNSCVLVAAAGNSGLCNQPGCPVHPSAKPAYPAALPYVIGVMSTNSKGSAISYFSNFDHYAYNNYEYEVYAVGEDVPSCWPNNKYASLNGTSMASPTVAGIAALLRSAYTDRDIYSTKFIQSQIVNASTIYLDGAHAIVDLQEALTKLPTPAVNLYGYRMDDSASISSKNNGNGVVDAGETVRLYISLHNRGGIATNINASIDAMRNGEFVDPYFNFINSTIQLSDIGTYSVRESGEQYFEIVVSADCPNDYIVDFNINFTYNNGMDEKDKTLYEGAGVIAFNVSRGFYLPATITEDTVYKADKLYIVAQDVVIPEGVTVTFEEGCEIQFYDDREYYNSPRILSYGKLIFDGKPDNMISIHPNARNEFFVCAIQGGVSLNYCNGVNIQVASFPNTNISVNNSILRANAKAETGASYHYACYFYSAGTSRTISRDVLFVKNGYQSIDDVFYNNSYVELKGAYACIYAIKINNCFVWAYGDQISNNMYVDELSDSVVVFEGDKKRGFSSSIKVSDLVTNNYFFSVAERTADLATMDFSKATTSNNMFSSFYKQNATQIIKNYYDSTGNPTVNVNGELADAIKLWPHVTGVEIFNSESEPITTIGKEEIKVRVTFNRPMDITKDTFISFGTIEPYADYRIDGEYVSETVWEGTYTLKAQIENGQNFMFVNNACAKEDPSKTVFGKYQLHEFTIDTTAAMSMNLQAFAKNEGVELLFAQDDYDTLLGYNIYRSEDKDGNFVKLNRTIVLPEDNTFLDDNAEPGKTYWYTYTVVLSDFTESAPAGKVQITAKDTLAPSLYHTPVNQGYENNNLIISCTASDNIGINTVTLYYRTVGQIEWKSLVMSKQNDKFSATIFGNEVTLDGIEYYIVASDMFNTVSKGSAEEPYKIMVKSAVTLLGKGDVDGNGQVTAKDALMLMQCLNGDLILTDDAFKRADLSGDGKLSSSEALRILQYVNGKLTTLDMQ